MRKLGSNYLCIKVLLENVFRVGVGYTVDSCMDCDECREGEEQFCAKGMTTTCDGELKHGNLKTNKEWTFGGYSGSHTVNER